MAANRRAADIGLAAIHIEGGLIAPSEVCRIAHQAPNEKLAIEYGSLKGTDLREKIAGLFNVGRATWRGYDKIENPTVQQTAAFARSMLEEVFGFDRLTGPIDHEVGGHRYRIAWEAKSGRVPVVVAAPDKDVDAFGKALPEFGDGPIGSRTKRSPAVLLQDWLNANQDFYWGLVFVGDRLRLMRDNASFTRPAYIEADLGAIFRDEMYADFTALWLLIHASRFGAADAPPSDCALERWRDAGEQAGTEVREHLRGNVEETLAILAQGFLDADETLRGKLDRGELSMQDWFNQILRIVYRLIFLAVAEDRNLLHAPETKADVRGLYAENYGFNHWRDRSARRLAYDHHFDNWETMNIVFSALQDGAKALGLPALGGLFRADQTPDLNEAKLSNRAFLQAVFRLAWFVDNNHRARINWRDMATEELGSVYESLLELVPFRENGGRSFVYANKKQASGHSRKSTSSYYTRDVLVQELLDRALDPVLNRAEQEAGEEGILKLKIIDPACGSGHFLLGAARRMANRVAQVRNIDAPDYQAAMRDVVRKCIYGADRNPMAVELAKVALWIETVTPGKPLGFLDANVICGDSLLGVFDLNALEEGIPDEAYKQVSDDDQGVAATLKRRNQAEKVGQGRFDWDSGKTSIPPKRMAADINHLRDLPEDTVAEVEAKRAKFEQWVVDPKRLATERACDLYMAAFLLSKREGGDIFTKSAVPTTAAVREALSGEDVEPAVLNAGLAAAQEARVLHWPLAFPDVMIGQGGFDVILGNPPWDTMSPDVKEFFGKYDPEIRFMAPTEQEDRLAELLQDPLLEKAWQRNQDELYRAANFMRNSGRFTLFAKGNLGKGDFNVYRMFTELAFTGVRPGGVAAQIIPENFYNGANAAALRHHVFQEMTLDTLITFENTKKVWFDIDSRQKFCLYSAVRGGSTPTIPAVFGINSEAKLAALEKELPFRIPLSLVRELSPAALAIAEFSDPRDVSIARKLHARLPSFGATIPDANARVYMREIDMGNDRDSFQGSKEDIPLFEGRMVEAFDYRAKAYVSGRGRKAEWTELSFDEPRKAIIPQWFIRENDLPEKLGDNWKKYRIGFCDVASPSNSRALVAAIIPPGVVCGHKVPSIRFEPRDDQLLLFWTAVANSFVVDFLARQKVALTMSYTVLDSLPLPRTFSGTPIEMVIARLATRLSCAGTEMTALWSHMAEQLEIDGEPAVEPTTRRNLRAELDVYIARDFFGLSKDEMRYLLDPSSVLGDDCGIETFGALKRAEMRADGRFTSFELIMEAWDNLDPPRDKNVQNSSVTALVDRQ